MLTRAQSTESPVNVKYLILFICCEFDRSHSWSDGTLRRCYWSRMVQSGLFNSSTIAYKCQDKNTSKCERSQSNGFTAKSTILNMVYNWFVSPF